MSAVPSSSAGLHALEINETRGFNRQDRRPETFALQARERLEHALVFRRNRDDMVEPVPLAAVPGGTLDGEIVGFGRTGGEHDLAGIGIDQLRHFGACDFNRSGSSPSECVGIDMRVPELLTEVGKHRIEHFRVERRRGLAIKINRML